MFPLYSHLPSVELLVFFLFRSGVWYVATRGGIHNCEFKRSGSSGVDDDCSFDELLGQPFSQPHELVKDVTAGMGRVAGGETFKFHHGAVHAHVLSPVNEHSSGEEACCVTMCEPCIVGDVCVFYCFTALAKSA